MLVLIANAKCSILISVFPARAGSAWYSTNMLDSMHTLKIVLSMAESMQFNSLKFCGWDARVLDPDA